MQKIADASIKWGFGLGTLIGVIGFFVFDPVMISIVLGTFIATVVFGRRKWLESARLTAIVGVILAIIYVAFLQFTSLDSLASITFAYFDHTLYLLIFGGVGCAIIGAFMGAITTGIRSLFEKRRQSIK